MKEEDNHDEHVSMLNEEYKMIKEWKELKMIVGLLKNDGTLRMEKFEETNDWMSKIRHTGTKNSPIPVMFRINSTLTLNELRVHQDNDFKEKGIHTYQKFTKMEHANKIIFLVGTNVQLSIIKCYDNMIKETIKGNAEEFEFSRSFVHEQGKKPKCIAINKMLSAKERIDTALHETKII